MQDEDTRSEVKRFFYKGIRSANESHCCGEHWSNWLFGLHLITPVHISCRFETGELVSLPLLMSSYKR